jgi:cell division protein FtsN
METPKTAPAPPEKTTEVKQGTVSEAEKPLSSPKPKGISPPPEKKAATPAPQPPPEKKVVAPAPKPSPPKQVAPEPAKTEPEKAPPPPKKIEEDVRLHYAIQVASSQDKRLAESHKDLLNNKGFTSYIEVINLESRGTFYRVMVGPFRTKTEAENVRGQLIRDSRFADCYVRYLP